MKRSTVLYVFCVCFLLMSGCVADDSSADAGEWISSVIKAKHYTDTRTLIDNEYHIHWVAGNAICMNGYVSEGATVTDDGKEASFDITYRHPNDNKYYAFYPAEMVNGTATATEAKSGYVDGKFTINFPNTQPYYDNVSFSDNVNPSVAYSNNTLNSMEFKNLCGILKIKLTLEGFSSLMDVSKIRFEANENVAGDATVVDPVSSKMTLGGNTAKTMDVVFCDEQGTPTTKDILVDVPISIYFVLPPNTYTGWKIVFLGIGNDVKATFKAKESITINSSKSRSAIPIATSIPGPKISYEGGDDVYNMSMVVGDKDKTPYTWSVESLKFPAGSGALVNHTFSLLDGSGNPIVLNTQYSLSTPLKVRFGRIWWPNREITDIKAEVKICIYKNGQEQSYKQLVVEQEPLTAKPLKVWDYGGYNYGYGSLSRTDGYMKTFRDILKNVFGLNTSILHTTQHASPTDETYNYIHITGVANDTYQDWTWFTNNNSLRVTRKLPMTVVFDDDNSYAVSNANANMLGAYNVVWSDGGFPIYKGLSVDNRQEDRNKRIYQFLTAHANVVNLDNVEWCTFGSDGNYSSATSLPSTAISLAKINRTSTNIGYLVSLDPKERLLYIGDCTLFYSYLSNTSSTQYNADAIALLKNIALYLRETAKYGGAFSDMLLDESSAPPAPWDNCWGTKKLTRLTQ